MTTWRLHRRQLGALAASALAGCAAGPAARRHDAVPAAVGTFGIDGLGWAAGTVGGRGGRLLRVTHLGASGPGSLAAAIEAEGPRIVVFDVGGTIDMGGRPLQIRHPFLTVAGQTAPSPGITVIKAETTVATHDVVIQHLRLRPGEWGRPKKGGGDQDGLSTLGGARRVVVDHCSFSWATDENLSASGPRFDGATPDDWRRRTSHDITCSHNLIAEGLSNSVHEKGEHSKGSLIHDNTSGVLLLRNVYVSNRERNALWKGGSRGAMVNNLIFNPGRVAVHYNLWAREWEGREWQTGRVALVGNVLRHGPDTAADVALFTLRGHGDVQLHLADNLAFGRDVAPAALRADRAEPGPRRARVIEQASADLPADVPLWPAARVERDLPAAAGARPWDRDAVDARLLRELAAGRGRIVDAETDTEHRGFVPQAATRRAFDPGAWNLDTMVPRDGWAAVAALTRPDGRAG